MTTPEMFALLPILIVGLTAVVVMLVIALKRNHKWVATISMAGLALTLVPLGVFSLSAVLPQGATALYVLDPFACFYMAMILVAALAVTAFSHTYLEGYQGRREEMYLLLLLSTLGGLVMVASRHFASFFLGLELLSMPMYGMAAYLVGERRSLEAGMKYLVLSAAASAFIAFGMALIYAQSGTLEFNEIGTRILAQGAGAERVALLGGALMLVGLGFKLSLAPFHLWTPDVYEGAPAPVASFLATASKIAVFALLLRYLVETRADRYGTLFDALSVLAILSIVVGNVLALQQTNLKRLLAYSAIAHFGYVLVALIGSGQLATEAVGVYLFTYSITSLVAFGVITLASSPYVDREAQTLSDYTGLFWRRPLLAAVLSVALLSLAGIPLTAGFVGKLYVLGTSVDRRQWLLLGAIVFGSSIGLYFYLRAMVQLYARPEPETASSVTAAFSSEGNWVRGAGGGMLIALALAMLALGIYPAPLIALARGAGL